MRVLTLGELSTDDMVSTVLGNGGCGIRVAIGGDDC